MPYPQFCIQFSRLPPADRAMETPKWLMRSKVDGEEALSSASLCDLYRNYDSLVPLRYYVCNNYLFKPVSGWHLIDVPAIFGTMWALSFFYCCPILYTSLACDFAHVFSVNTTVRGHKSVLSRDVRRERNLYAEYLVKISPVVFEIYK